MAVKTAVIAGKKKEHRKNLIKIFDKISYRHGKHNVWRDFIYMCAAALSQPFDFKQNREDEYLRIIKSYDKETQDLFVDMFGELILAFQEEGFGDILGEVYSELGMTNEKNGQFFTPYHICCMMAALNGDGEGLTAEIQRKGYISVNDPCCGGGAMLIAFAEHCRDSGIDYEKSVLFVAQDIDPLVSLMCYLQMTLLNMSGYVLIGNTLSNEIIDESHIWVTPAYYLNEFHFRIQNTAEDTDEIIETETVQAVTPDFDIMFRESDSGQIVFDFDYAS